MEALHALVQKNAVENFQTRTCLAFFSRLFLVPKPNNKLRPVLDLSLLNKYLKTEILSGDTRKHKDFLADR